MRCSLYGKSKIKTYFKHGVDGGKDELSITHVVKGIIEKCLGFLHPIELVEISYSCT